VNPRYSMLIRWSEEDGAFLVAFPELTGADQPQTHGNTYEEAAKNGQDVLELLVETYRAHGRPLPEPSMVTYDQDT
jgi:antitoxin HicB